MGQLSTKDWLKNIEHGLMSKLEESVDALPPGFNRDRFVLNSLTVIQDMLNDSRKRDELAKIRPETIPMCLIKGAFLGLDFLNGECYAIPYKGVISFQTDYKGEIKICKRFSKNKIRTIYAKNVRKGDVFQEKVEHGVQDFVFEPKPFSDGEIIGTFAVVVYEDGTMMYDTMSKSEIETVRNCYSKAKDSPAWKNSPGEMYKKTVIRRLCKTIDLNFDKAEAYFAFEDGGDVRFDNAPQNVLDAKQAMAIAENEKVVDAVAIARDAKEKEAVPVSAPAEPQSQAEQPPMDDYAAFEQQYQGEPWGDEDELPFK